LPHPEAVDAPPIATEEHLNSMKEERERIDVSLGDRVKGVLKVIEGKLLCNSGMVEAGRAQNTGIPVKDRR